MIRSKITSLTLAAVTVAGISLLTTSADAQGRRSFWGGWGQSSGCNVNTLRSDVYSADRLANQMVHQFSREMNYRCSCSVQLLNYLKRNAQLTRNLVTASNGSCKCTFEKAACALNTNTAIVARQSRKVHNLSCMMKGNISETVTLARRIHSNVDQFVPRGSYTNNRRPAPAPVYGTPARGHDHNSRNHSPSRNDQLSSIIFSLFNR